MWRTAEDPHTEPFQASHTWADLDLPNLILERATLREAWQNRAPFENTQTHSTHSWWPQLWFRPCLSQSLPYLLLWCEGHMVKHVWAVLAKEKAQLSLCVFLNLIDKHLNWVCWPSLPSLCFLQDRRIEELTLLLNQCRQFREVTPNTRQGNQLTCDFILPLPRLFRDHNMWDKWTLLHFLSSGWVEQKHVVSFATVAPPAVHPLSNGRTPSISSEEEVHGLMKNMDSASAKSEDLKSEVAAGSLTMIQTCAWF